MDATENPNGSQRFRVSNPYGGRGEAPCSAGARLFIREKEIGALAPLRMGEVYHGATIVNWPEAVAPGKGVVYLPRS